MNPYEKAQACFQYVNMTCYSEKNRQQKVQVSRFNNRSPFTNSDVIQLL